MPGLLQKKLEYLAFAFPERQLLHCKGRGFPVGKYLLFKPGFMLIAVLDRQNV